jgi:hypothetical protein
LQHEYNTLERKNTLCPLDHMFQRGCLVHQSLLYFQQFGRTARGSTALAKARIENALTCRFPRLGARPGISRCGIRDPESGAQALKRNEYLIRARQK